MADDDLQKRLERLGQQLVADVEAWERRTRSERAQVLDRLTHTIEDKLERAMDTLAEKEARRREKEAQREERRARRRERSAPSIATGVVFLIAAVVCAVVGLTNQQLFWMIFVALGLGISGAGQLTAAARKGREVGGQELEAKVPEPVSQPERHEVDVVCDQLLSDLAAAPQAVRSFVSEPEKTVASMRTTLKSLDQRRKQLAAEDAKGRLAELARQHETLTARRDSASDPPTRQRMTDALSSIAGQRHALEQLVVMAERVDGEYTSLLVHLQELRTRVSVARSTSGAVEFEGVKASVQRLNEELGAISEAMEAVRRGDVSPVTSIEGSEAAREDRTRVAD